MKYSAHVQKCNSNIASLWLRDKFWRNKDTLNAALKIAEATHQVLMHCLAPGLLINEIILTTLP